MSRGDDFPRYTYMMDFNPMDEDTPLRDYWQTTDDLDNEDAATIASLATQVLQSKSGYEYGDGMGMSMGVGVGMEVNEPGVVAEYMYSESRSSPQSQYSTTLPTEPAESFRGLMDDHDRGVQILEEGAASEYDLEPEARGHEASHVHGIDEPTMLSREQDAPETFRSTLLSVAAEVDVTNQSSYSHEIEMSAAMTASRVVNGVLRRSYAGTPTEEVVNLQALQSHAPQLTPPISESRSVSVETPDYGEQEKEPTMETDDQHVDDEPDDEPEDTPMTKDDEGEDWEEDEGGEREEIEGDETEEFERGEREEDEGGETEGFEGEERDEDEGGERAQGEERETSEDLGDGKEDEVGETEGDKGEETEKDEMDEEEPTPDTGAQQQLITESNERPAVDDDEELPPLQETPRKRGRSRRKQPTAVEIAVPEKDTHTENEEVESAVTDGTDPNKAEEMPTGRRQPETATAPTSAKRGPGRPPKATDIELTLEAAPAAGKRGRPRRKSMVNATQLTAIAHELSAAEASTATTPHKSSMASTEEVEPLAVEAVVAVPRSSSRRGRSRKSDTKGAAQEPTEEVEPLEVEASTIAAPAPSKRGRPRKSDAMSAAQASTEEVEPLVVEASITATTALSKRGRRPRSNVTGVPQASIEEVEPLAVETSITETTASSKRGRPPKSAAIITTHTPIEELQLSSVETPATTTPAPSKRGRPRKMPTHEAPLAVDEAPITATPASGGLPSQASVKTSTTTPGRRGRLPKGTLQTEDDIWAVDSPPSQSIGRRGRPLRQVDALEERDGSPSPLPKKRRGRGRPPKGESLLPADLPSAAVEPGLGMATPIDDVSKDLDEDMEATPVRKRGRRKAAAVDKPVSKKRGRPPRAMANIDSAEEQGRPDQSEVQEEEEEPAAKRRRTSNDVPMEDAVDEEEAQGNAQEDELPGVGDLGDAVAANGTRRKRSSVTWAQPLTSSLTSPQTGRRPRLSGEMLGESTKTKQVEQPSEAPAMPKTLYDMISDGRKMGRQKTYGKRSKR
ncbi:hypothetical protein J3E68DRAFT_434704 [Trichoderma sp. SZMC 28012]